MKTMQLQQQISKFFLFCLLTLVSANSFAETKWEVGTLFFGNDETTEFQAGIEENLKELSRIKTTDSLRISTYKEGADGRSLRSKLPAFLKKSFKDPEAKKILVVYGHGTGPLGMKDFSANEMREILLQSKIKFDIIWFDSCFLANLEFLYELKSASSYSIASEEAEFTAGLPFESLSELPSLNTTLDAATFLAKRFIESYSYLKKGEQRDAVSTSSATISVIDNAELENFAVNLKKVSQIITKLSPTEQLTLKNKLTKKFSMENIELVDLGHLLIELRALVKDKASDLELTKLIRLLNIESVKKLQTNPRVRLTAPTAGALMVFGFNNWTNGQKEEYNNNPLFKDIINTKMFGPGPNNKEWPVRKFENNSMLISPFAPGINSFNYYFLDATGNKLLSDALTITRTHDVIETSLSKKTAGSFLVYTAYTQRLGVKAERYTGVSITNFNTAPSMDYFELDFNQLSGWLKL